MTTSPDWVRRTPIQHSLDLRCSVCGGTWEIPVTTDESYIVANAIIDAHLTDWPRHKITSAEILREEHLLNTEKLIMEDSE